MRSGLTNGNTFGNFKDLAQWIGGNLRIESAVFDGEIACVHDYTRRTDDPITEIRTTQRILPDLELEIISARWEKE